MRLISAVLFVLSVLAWAEARGADNRWSLEPVEDVAGYGSAVALRQDSSKTIKDESAAGDVTPQIEFRCTPGDATVTARIDWQRFISSFSTEVGFKVDGGRFMWLKWKADQSEQVTLSPSGEDSQKLIDALIAGKELLVEVSPYSQAPVTAAFELDGLSVALASLVGSCQ